MAKARLCPKCRTPWPEDYEHCPLCGVIAHLRVVSPLSKDDAQSFVKHRKFDDFYEARVARRDAGLIRQLRAAWKLEQK